MMKFWNKETQGSGRDSLVGDLARNPYFSHTSREPPRRNSSAQKAGFCYNGNTWEAFKGY